MLSDFFRYDNGVRKTHHSNVCNCHSTEKVDCKRKDIVDDPFSI